MRGFFPHADRFGNGPYKKKVLGTFFGTFLVKGAGAGRKPNFVPADAWVVIYLAS